MFEAFTQKLEWPLNLTKKEKTIWIKTSKHLFTLIADSVTLTKPHFIIIIITTIIIIINISSYSYSCDRNLYKVFQQIISTGVRIANITEEILKVLRSHLIN